MHHFQLIGQEQNIHRYLMHLLQNIMTNDILLENTTMKALYCVTKTFLMLPPQTLDLLALIQNSHHTEVILICTARIIDYS